MTPQRLPLGRSNPTLHVIEGFIAATLITQFAVHGEQSALPAGQGCSPKRSRLLSLSPVILKYLVRFPVVLKYLVLFPVLLNTFADKKTYLSKQKILASISSARYTETGT